ncbi:hypothetical protein EDB81DRAFT_849730 [Dactylonectria macrodidyma]|uniref:Woronin body major protein n=1 Tax=Dactylonectria macrodidyma TaxID=307937 RepID=A0A9P9JIG4_9HYPO|nr:hypothetical protein EDB81DRAFT_849730 [Dactylonectria macrodidyma]
MLVCLLCQVTEPRRLVAHCKVVNLDFEARVPVPFSIFPSTYRDHESQTQTTTTTQVHAEVDIKPAKPQAGREGQYSSYSATAEVVPPREEHHHSEEEVRITREEERYHRPGVQQQQTEHFHQTEQYIREDRRRPEPASEHTTSHAHVEIDTRHPYYSTPIDIAERQYRERFRPSKPEFSVDPPSRPQYQTSDTFQVNNYTVEGRPSQYKTTEKTEINNYTVEQPRPQYSSFEKTEINNFTVDGRASCPPQHKQSTQQFNDFTVDTPVSRPSYKQQDVKFTEETVETTKVSRPQHKSKMGYYDEDGHYHSFRAGAHKLADKIAHPRGYEHVEIDVVRAGSRPAGTAQPSIPNTVSIPCHHIRLGDFLMLQGRACQVIRISTSSATGQYRYLGVDLFTKQLHEESSFISNPAPSVVVQTMLGPVFKQYRVLDMQDGLIVAMTETGDVKQGLPVIDQSNLYTRLHSAFESGRGSLRVLVLNDGGRELAVDMKVIHGSRL